MSMRHLYIHGRLRHMHGYRPDPHDPRDRELAVHHGRLLATQSSASTRSIYKPPVRDQLTLGSCTANAGCEAAGFLHWWQAPRGSTDPYTKEDPMFSRLDMYAVTRELEGTPLTEDAGASVRSVFKAMARYGVCFEKTWPYLISSFDRQPPRRAMLEALKHKAIVYLRCPTLADIRASIAAGFPVIGGFRCFESLQSEATGRTGDVPLPQPHEAEIGGHCVYFDAYNDTDGMLGFQNSWGLEWGNAGFGRLPYEYVENGWASDFWTLRSAT